MEMRFWEDNSLQHVKFESNSNDNIPPRQREPFYCEAANLNFATGDDDCMDYTPNGYRKTPLRVSRQDPLSHRIIEKRRRDRMNNCLADLSRLIPAEYLKKGRGRVEKTEIIEMAIKHMKHLQYLNHYRLGFQECMSEAVRFLVDVEGRFPREPSCVRLLGHLQAHCDGVCRAAGEAPPCVAPSVDKVELKVEPNNNYDDADVDVDADADVTNATNGFEMEEPSHDVDLDAGSEREREKREEHHAAYKYKNDIKLRFTQDNANARNPTLADRRNSTPISTDYHTCSSIDSPTAGHFVTHQSVDDTPTTTPTPWTLSIAPPPPPANPEAFLSHAIPLNNGNGTSAFTNFEEKMPKLRKPTPLLDVKHLTNGAAGNIHHLNGNGHAHHEKHSFLVPAFALHTKGSFYIPLTLDYHALLPYLGAHDLLAAPPDVVLHPVAINVNFPPPAKKFEAT